MLTKQYQASVIIPVYKNIENLSLILYALKIQTFTDFDIIITEDDNNQQVKEYIQNISSEFPNLCHITQTDKGFRKCLALNRGILRAQSDYLIFLDGDCVPHPRFVEGHLRNAQTGFTCVGRRAEFGKRLSRLFLSNHSLIHILKHKILYMLIAIPAFFDRASYYEAGLFSTTLQYFNRNKNSGLIGCNFSMHRHDIEKVNGFDEEYVHTGTEDSDLEWRLVQMGIKMKNSKFLTPTFHMDHPKSPILNHYSGNRFRETKRLNRVICAKGLNQH